MLGAFAVAVDDSAAVVCVVVANESTQVAVQWTVLAVSIDQTMMATMIVSHPAVVSHWLAYSPTFCTPARSVRALSSVRHTLNPIACQ